MNTEPLDGGPAFPRAASPRDNGDYSQEGMSLRDWFAGQALAMFAGKPEDFAYNEIADICYRTADAMLAARSVKAGQ